MANVESLRGHIPDLVVDELALMSDREQQQWVAEFDRRAWTTGNAYVFWLLAGLHYAYLKRWGFQLLFWATLGGFVLWWVYDLFRMRSLVAEANADIALDVLRDIRLLQAGRTTP